MSKIFISGIDTDAGKSYCTAWYANRLTAEAVSYTHLRAHET